MVPRPSTPLTLPPAPHAQLVAALEHSALVVGLFDERDMLRWANARYEKLFLRGLMLPVSFGNVLRHGFKNGFGVKLDCGDIEAFLADILPRRRSAPSRAFTTDTVDGVWLWMTETLLPDGWLLSVATDVTPLKQQERLLQQAHAEVLKAAMTDPLTGAPNRRHIMGLCEASLRNLGDGENLTIALIDLDRFKRINDEHGHDAGDAVLRGLVAHFHSHSRTADALGRWGGEEFMLLVHGAGADQALGVVDRLRDWPCQADVGRCTFSAGVAQAQRGETMEALLKRADVALYAAKAQGGDCSVVAL